MFNDKRIIILLALVITILFSQSVLSVCTVTLDQTEYIAGDTATATMSCSSSAEKNTAYSLTWRDETNSTIVETDTGTTPNTPGTEFNEDYIIPFNWTNGHVLSATLTGSQLEGSDSAIVYTGYDLNSTLVYPDSSQAIYINDTFNITCFAENTGGGDIPLVTISPVYSDGNIISNSSGNILLNESGSYSCGTLNESQNCSYTWEATGNLKSQNDIGCKATDTVSDTSSTQRINIFETNDDISITLTSDSYSPGESVTAKLTSYFTNTDYVVTFYNSTGSTLCNHTGTTPSTSEDPFFESCVLDSNIIYQDNNSVIFYLNDNPTINVTDYFDISNISSNEYIIQNILLKYEDAFLGYSQSIKGTVIDSNGDYAIAECCRLQIDDATTGAPIFTSEDEIIDGAGSCETHWTLDQDVFESPKSYSAMIIAWQCSDEDLPSSDRKRGTGTTSFSTKQYFTETEDFITVVDGNIYSGLDTVTLYHERINNFGKPMEVIEDIWFANVETEQDYHYDELEDVVKTVNIGTSTEIQEVPIPLDLSTATYRLEKHTYYYYNGNLKETVFVKSESFNITNWQDGVTINSIYLLDPQGYEVDITSDDSFNLSDKPISYVTMGLPFSVCINYDSNYSSQFYGEISSLSLVENYKGDFEKLINTNNYDEHREFELKHGTDNDACGEFIFPDRKTVSNLWHTNLRFHLGSNEYSDYFSVERHNNFVALESNNFYADTLQGTFNIPEWWVSQNETYEGDPGVWVEDSKGNKLSVHADIRPINQENLTYEANQTCYDDRRGINMTCDYSKYLQGGKKFRVCMKAQNYLQEPVNIEFLWFTLDDDYSHQQISYEGSGDGFPRRAEIQSYYEPYTNGCDGNCVDKEGFDIICSDFMDLPDSVIGSNSYDVEGEIRFTSPFYQDHIFPSPTLTYSSDEFAVKGFEYEEGYYRFNNPLQTLSQNYTMGEPIMLHINLTNLGNIKSEIHIHLLNELGVEVYTWEDTRLIDFDDNIDTAYPLLLPVNEDTIIADAEFKLQIHMFPEGGDGVVSDYYAIEDSNWFNISLFEAVISENITSSTVSNTEPLTIDYELNIPTKAMLFYPNKNQPFRIKYHFLNDGGQAVSQFDMIDGQYAPLEAYSMFPAGTTQNFSVLLQPTNLEPGNYTIVQEIEIDPPVNGVAVWESVHKGEVGTFEVTETLVNAPIGLVQTTEKNYELSNSINNTVTEINTTTHSILDLLNTIDLLLEDINQTVNEINDSSNNILVDLSNIENRLISLREEVDYSNEFSKESVFLITDSIVATREAQATDDKDEIIAELRLVEGNLKKLRDGNNDEKASLSSTLIIISIIIMLALSTFILWRILKSRKTEENFYKEDNFYKDNYKGDN